MPLKTCILRFISIKKSWPVLSIFSGFAIQKNISTILFISQLHFSIIIIQNNTPKAKKALTKIAANNYLKRTIAKFGMFQNS